MDERIWEVCARLVELRRMHQVDPVLPDRWLHLVEHLCRHSLPEVSPYSLVAIIWAVVYPSNSPRRGSE